MVGSCRRRAGHRACPCTKEPTMGGSSTARYATSALRAAQRTFGLVTAEPTNLYLYGEDFGEDLPAGPIALPWLRDLLLAASTALPTRDAVWRGLVGHARPGPGAWGGGGRRAEVPVGLVATVLGEVTNTVVQRRHRAENRLAAALAEGKISEVVLEATFVSDRAVEARLNGVVSLPPKRPRVAARLAG